MVRQITRYIWLVLKRSVTGVFIVVDVVGTILLLWSLNQPTVPRFISLGVFATMLVISSFLVWEDAENDNKKLRAKITAMKNGVPKYTVDTGAIEKYSIAKPVDQATDELEAVQAKLKLHQNVESPNSINAALRTLGQLTVNLPRLIGSETLDDKEERLAEHLEKLIAFEDKLKMTYKVPLFFEATRADGNVEFQVEVIPESTLVVEDDYVDGHLPKTHTPSFYDAHNFTALNHTPSGGFANRLYPYSYAEDGIGYSKLNKINASRKYSVFDEDFYVQTDSDSVELKITIHSEKIIEPQIIHLKLGLKGAATNEITHINEE